MNITKDSVFDIDESHQLLLLATDILDAIWNDDVTRFIQKSKVIVTAFSSNEEEIVRYFTSLLIIDQEYHNSIHGHKSTFKMIALYFAVRYDKRNLISHLIKEIDLSDIMLRELLLISIRYSCFNSLNILAKRLDNMNQLIDGRTDNLLCMALKEGNMEMAKYLREKGCDLVIQISMKHAGDFDYQNIEPFLSQIISSNHHNEYVKLMTVQFALSTGVDLHGDHRSRYKKPIEAAFIYSPFIASLLVDEYFRNDFRVDLPGLIKISLMSKEMTFAKKRVLLEIILSKYEIDECLLEATLLDTLNSSMMNMVNTRNFIQLFKELNLCNRDMILSICEINRRDDLIELWDKH